MITRDSNSKIKVVRLSIISNSVLIILKLFIGFLIGSISVLSEAIHSAIDLVAALIAFFAVKSSDVPADNEHRYGHGKFESVSGFVEAILIFGAAAWIIYEAVGKLIIPEKIELIGWGILVMAFSGFMNLVVSQMLFKVGNETDSMAIKADAWHLRTDVYTSAGVMVGLFFIWLLEIIFKGRHFHWIDPVIAIIVALMILKAAYQLTRQSLVELVDTCLPENEIKAIENMIRNQEGARGFRNLKTRKSGNIKFIEFDLFVDCKISVENAHKLTDYICENIKSVFKNSEITIHIEPYAG